MAQRCLCGFRGRLVEGWLVLVGLRVLVMRAIRISPLNALDQDLLSSRTNFGRLRRSFIDGSSGIGVSLQNFEKRGAGVAGHVLSDGEQEALIPEFRAALGGVESFRWGFGCASEEEADQAVG